MSFAKRAVHGVVHHEPARTQAGFNLYAPMYGKNVWLMDMEGRIVHRWAVENLPGNYGMLLPNGNLLFAGRLMPPPIPEFAGNGGQLVEYDWQGNKVWEYIEPFHSHCFAPLRNGNLIISKWSRVPAQIARRVRGGQPGSERNGEEMWSETLQEIDRAGHVVWQWASADHLDPETDAIGPLHPRDRWTNLNSVSELPDGRLLVSYRCINTVAIIDRSSGDFAWKWGPGIVAGQHHPSWLDNGNILLFDNGAHRAYTTVDYSRVVEVNPKTDAIEWEYKANPVFDLNSFICSGAQRLANGNTLICSTNQGLALEVSRDGDTVWEFHSPFYYEHPIFGTNNMIFRCYRYDAGHAGIRDAVLDPGRYEDVNALMPKQFTSSPRSTRPLGTTYLPGGLARGGH